MDDLVRKQFCAWHCNKYGVQQGVVNFSGFCQRMYDLHPNEQHKELKKALRRFIEGCSYAYCDSFPKDDKGEFLDNTAAYSHLQMMRADLGGEVTKIWDGIRARNAKAASASAKATPPTPADQKTGLPNSSVIMKPVTSLSQPQSSKSAPTATVSDSSDSMTLAPSHDTKLRKFQRSEAGARHRLQANVSSSADREAPNFSLISKLLKTKEGEASRSRPSDAVERSICQAPLVAAGIIAEHYNDLVPQYGLLGNLEAEYDAPTNSQLFLNTNVPFSAFICGVQGSGKSHTTSCILENSILASPQLGHLGSPVSALVFSYGMWSCGGAGFNISEATFLGASHPSFPNHNVKEVTVLYSPSNPAIKRAYERLPNVQMVPFRLKAKTLDIGALHTLMAVDEKSKMPLYMVTVEGILRDMATRSFDGSLDYSEFKRRLGKEKFDKTQSSMLQMRMNLLDSFLDLDNKTPMLGFKPGGITIIDLSDPFLTPSTACILFKLGLEQFLQSSAPGKMIVLDEAHKYMHDTPGSKMFANYLTDTIRLQRHKGARIIISTQEPTIAADLIALCSVTIMHRFMSPAWYAALRKHINAVEDDWTIMQCIEALDTGEALVYCPNAVLGKKEDGVLFKPIGRLMRVNIRNRVTLDGGASIMAV